MRSIIYLRLMRMRAGVLSVGNRESSFAVRIALRHSILAALE